MSTTAGIFAGMVVVGGAVAVYRFARRKAREMRAAIDEFRGGPRSEGGVLDFERDPLTGVYRRKP